MRLAGKEKKEKWLLGEKKRGREREREIVQFFSMAPETSLLLLFFSRKKKKRKEIKNSSSSFLPSFFNSREE